MTDTIEPVFTHKEPGPFFSASEAAARIAETGEDRAPVATQLRNFAQRGLIVVRGTRGSGRTASNLYAPADLATAAVLRTLVHLGIADNDILKAASVACYTWRVESDKDLTPDAIAKLTRAVHHPITAALLGFVDGEWWQFRLDLDMNEKTGRRSFVARLYDTDRMSFPARKDPNTVPMATITIPAMRFAPRILADTSGMN